MPVEKVAIFAKFLHQPLKNYPLPEPENVPHPNYYNMHISTTSSLLLWLNFG